MSRTQIKQLNIKIDKMLRFKKLPSMEEMGMPRVLIEKYGLATKTLK